MAQRGCGGAELPGAECREIYGIALLSTHEVWARHQPQNRQAPRPDDSAVAPAAGDAACATRRGVGSFRSLPV